MKNVSTLLRPTMSSAALFILAICFLGISTANVQAAGTTFVNDNWHLLADNDASNSLTVGDTIRNDNDTINVGSVMVIYGVDGFGTVTTGAFTGSLAGAVTINDAIANTNVSGTVNVLAGTYFEFVTVNKTVSLRGAQAGVDARTRIGTAESIVRGVSGSTSFNVTASGVEIDGFTVQDNTLVNQFGTGILLGAGTNGSEVRNNIIQNNITGLILANNSAVSQTVIERNLFRNNNNAGSGSGSGIYTDQFVAGGTVSNVLVDNNTFVGHTAVAIFLSTVAATPATNITVSNNLFDANARALAAINLTSSQIRDNTMRNSTNAAGDDLRLFEGVSGLTITRNVLENGAGRALRISNLGTGAPDATNVSFRLNSVSGYTGPAGTFEVDAGAYTGILDATNTWWGNITGPTIASNPGGTGQTIVDLNGVVDFQPWLAYAPDADPGTPGVQVAACAAISFSAAGTFTAGSLPNSVTTGDFNGDGKTDLAVANFLSHNVSVLSGNGDGTLATAVNFAVGITPHSVTTGDFNGDGKTDLATANTNANNVSVLMGNGDGTFAAAVNFAAGFGPRSVTTGDFNGDGKTDLAAANQNSDNVSVLIGNGDGTFAAGVNYPAGDVPFSITTGDFNSDGKTDLAAANLNSDNVSVLIGNGDGTFAAGVNYPAGDVPFSITTGDFNGDGKTDLAAANQNSDNISVFTGNGDGTFAAAVNLATGDRPLSVTTGDFNGDGKTDLATANGDSDNIAVLTGNGDGTFAAPVNFAAGDRPYSIATGDFNGDARADLATGNINSHNISVLLNSCTSNTAPVAVNDSYSVNEDPASPLTGNVLDNDTDGENNALSAALTAAAPNGLTFNSDGSFSFTPAANFNGSVQFTYKANDGTLDSNEATVTITVNPVNDAPVVSATPETQPAVQYSDAIQTVTIVASDVETSAAALSIAFSYTKNGGATVNGLPNGMTQGGTGGAWTVSGTAGVSAGTYVITASVTDSGDGTAAAVTSSDTFTIVVQRESAVAAPRVNNPVSKQVASPGGTASGTTASICFDISEIVDGSAGDTSLITSASVQISAVGGGGNGGITASAVSFAGGGVGSARRACFTLTLVNSPTNAYEVTLVIGGDYYTGSGTTAFVVFDPSAGFASGGGWMINPNTGFRANYGVNVKYLKNGNAQGSILYVEHRPDGDYKVKSTSLNSGGGFAIVPVTGGYEAQIAGKATYFVNDVGTGNHAFIVRMIDRGTPGTNDAFGLKLINPSGQAVFSFDPVLLGGGNNQVPKK